LGLQILDKYFNHPNKFFIASNWQIIAGQQAVNLFSFTAEGPA
jgi:hypothetical protein